MKLVSVVLLVLCVHGHIVREARPFRLPSVANLAVGGPYDHCVALLEKILLETNDMAQHIMNKEWQKVVPLAIKLSKDIYDDVLCFQHPHSEESLLAPSSNDPTECIIKHVRAAAEALQSAIDEAQAKHWKEAARFVLIAIAEIHEAQMCK